MKRIAVLLAALVVAACSGRQPAPGSYVQTDDLGRKEIHIVHGDCVALNLEDSSGTMLASVGPFKKKGRYPHYTYRYRQGGSDITITARFADDGQLEAKLAGRVVWGSTTVEVETPNWLVFSANFQQTE